MEPARQTQGLSLGRRAAFGTFLAGPVQHSSLSAATWRPRPLPLSGDRPLWSCGAVFSPRSSLLWKQPHPHPLPQARPGRCAGLEIPQTAGRAPEPLRRSCCRGQGLDSMLLSGVWFRFVPRFYLLSAYLRRPLVAPPPWPLLSPGPSPQSLPASPRLAHSSTCPGRCSWTRIDTESHAFLHSPHFICKAQRVMHCGHSALLSLGLGKDCSALPLPWVPNQFCPHPALCPSFQPNGLSSPTPSGNWAPSS